MKVYLLAQPASDRYKVVTHFTEKFHEALLAKDVDCRILPEEAFFTVPFTDPPDLTVQFNDCPSDEKRRLLCDLTGIPHAALLVDPPFRVLRMTLSPHMIFSCDDRYWNEVLDQMGFKRNFFFPHAADKGLLCDIEEKKYAIAMLATCIDYASLEQTIGKVGPGSFADSFLKAAAVALSDNETSYALALNREILKWYPKEIFKEIDYPLFLRALEMYIKGVDRTMLASSITGAPVDLFGGPFPAVPWSHYLGGNPHVRLHEGVPFNEALEIMRRTKILLNSSVKNKQGAHERIFLGILSGALVVTHDNPYLREYFVDEESIIFYRHSELDKLNDKLMPYLENESRRREIVARGREIVLKHHTWDERADLFIQKAESFIK